MNIKTCSKCGFIGEESLFIKDGNICKKCKSEYYKQIIINQEGKIKTCSKCNFTGESNLFGKRGNICKKCENLANKEKRNKKIEKEKGKEKTCFKCNFIGKENLFVKGRNVCKKCQIEYEKQLAKTQECTIKTCIKCNFVGDNILFGKCSNICLECENKNHNEWRNLRRENDPDFKLKEFCSRNINSMLKSKDSSKAGKSCKDYLPFKQEELTPNIESKFESWMNWNNQGSYNLKTWVDEDILTHVWNLDHFIPHSFLPYSSMEDKNFKIVWDLANLRPLSAKQNILDNNRRTITEIKNDQELKDITRLISLLDEIINDEGIKPELKELYHNFIKVVNEYKAKTNIK
jgi:hypothetical protein